MSVFRYSHVILTKLTKGMVSSQSVGDPLAPEESAEWSGQFLEEGSVGLSSHGPGRPGQHLQARSPLRLRLTCARARAAAGLQRQRRSERAPERVGGAVRQVSTAAW